ncbi:MAG: 2OG-Fe(II) oxygenase, partial [Pirellulales bacterium]
MPQDVAKKLLAALEKIDRPGTFCVARGVPAVLPGLIVRDVGSIALPLIPAQAEELKQQCRQAPYGKGEKTLVDTQVRRVWRMTPDRFKLANPDWKKFLDHTVGTVQEELGLEGEQLEAHLYDLLLYEQGSFFLPHRDGEKLDRMVATLVVVLPSSYQGGELVVRHDGHEQTVDFSAVENGLFRVHFVAFYADCEHEIRPLRTGHRLALVYNLTLAKSGRPIAAPRSSEHIAEIVGILHRWSQGEGADKLVVTLDHQYTQEGLAWDALKGTDRAKASVLRQAARQAGCQAHLALLTYWQHGSAEYDGGSYGRHGRRGSGDDAAGEEHIMGEVFDSSLTADHWVDPEGNRLALGEMPVEEQQLV